MARLRVAGERSSRTRPLADWSPLAPFPSRYAAHARRSRCRRAGRGLADRGAGGRGRALRGGDHARHGRADRPAGPARSDRPPVRAGSGRAGGRPPRGGRSDRRCGAQPGPGDRAPLSRPGADQAGPCLPGLLPVLLSPRGRGTRRRGHAHARRAGGSTGLHRGAAGDLGGGRHRRRSPDHDATAPALPGREPRRDRACGRRALAYPRPGRGARAHRGRAGRRAAGGGCRHLAGRPRQPSARARPRPPSRRWAGWSTPASRS